MAEQDPGKSITSINRNSTLLISHNTTHDRNQVQTVLCMQKWKKEEQWNVIRMQSQQQQNTYKNKHKTKSNHLIWWLQQEKCLPSQCSRNWQSNDLGYVTHIHPYIVNCPSTKNKLCNTIDDITINHKRSDKTNTSLAKSINSMCNACWNPQGLLG